MEDIKEVCCFLRLLLLEFYVWFQQDVDEFAAELWLLIASSVLAVFVYLTTPACLPYYLTWISNIIFLIFRNLFSSEKLKHLIPKIELNCIFSSISNSVIHLVLEQLNYMLSTCLIRQKVRTIIYLIEVESLK